MTFDFSSSHGDACDFFQLSIFTGAIVNCNQLLELTKMLEN